MPKNPLTAREPGDPPVECGLRAKMVVNTVESAGELEGKVPGSLAGFDLPLLAAAIEQAAEAIVITDTDARIQYVNPAFSRMTGYSAREAIGETTAFLKSCRQDPNYYRDLWNTILAGQVWHGELINRRKDGTVYNEEMTIAPVRNAGGTITNFIAIKQDVTDQRAAEAALREREREARRHLARLEQIYNDAPVGLAFVDREFRVQRINERLAAGSGWPVEEVIGKRIRELAPGIATQLEEMWRKVFETGEPILDVEVRGNPRPEVGERSLLCSFFPLKSETNEITGGIASVLDITARKASEEALKISEEKYLSLLNSTAEAIYGLDLEGNCTFCNPACVRMIGYETSEELLGKNMHAVIHHSLSNGSPYPEEECKITWRSAKAGDACLRRGVWWRKDGGCFFAEYWSYPIYQAGELVGAVVTFLDISDRKRASEALTLMAERTVPATGGKHSRSVLDDELRGHGNRLRQSRVRARLGTELREPLSESDGVA